MRGRRQVNEWREDCDDYAWRGEGADNTHLARMKVKNGKDLEKPLVVFGVNLALLPLCAYVLV